MQDGLERPIAYSSRTLTKAERNYCVTRRELASGCSGVCKATPTLPLRPKIHRPH